MLRRSLRSLSAFSTTRRCHCEKPFESWPNSWLPSMRAAITRQRRLASRYSDHAPHTMTVSRIISRCVQPARMVLTSRCLSRCPAHAS